MERFQACFAGLADPRTGNAQRHDLLEILLIALAATLCGAEGCVDMALFGVPRSRFCGAFSRCRAAYRAMTPSRACSGCSIRPRSRPGSPLRSRVQRPHRAGREPQVVAVDGKTARRSFDRRRGQRPLHLISAWAVEQRLVLGQRKVDAASNETGRCPNCWRC